MQHFKLLFIFPDNCIFTSRAHHTNALVEISSYVLIIQLDFIVFFTFYYYQFII